MKYLTVSLLILISLSIIGNKYHYDKYQKKNDELNRYIIKADLYKQKLEESNRKLKKELEDARTRVIDAEEKYNDLIGSYDFDYPSYGVLSVQEVRTRTSSNEVSSCEARTNTIDVGECTKRTNALLKDTFDNFTGLLRLYENLAREAEKINLAYTSCTELLK